VVAGGALHIRMERPNYKWRQRPASLCQNLALARCCMVVAGLACAYGGSCRGRFRWLAAGVVTALLSPAALPLTCGKTVCSAVARNTISTIYLLCSDNDEAANLLARALISRIPTHLYCRPRPR